MPSSDATTTNRHGVRLPWSGTCVAACKMLSICNSSGAGAVSFLLERRMVNKVKISMLFILLFS